MPLARTIRLQQTSSISHGTGNITSTAFTPSDNSLLLLVAFYIAEADGTGEGTDLSVVSNTGGLTFTSQAVTTTSPGWRYGIRAWTAPVTTGASMTVTVGTGGINVHRYRLVAVDYTGYNTGSPVGATAVGSDADGDGAASITLSGTPASTSEIFAGALTAFNGATAISIDNGSGWTEQDDVGETSWAAFQTQYRTGYTGTSVDWADMANGMTGAESGSVMLAVEIREAAGGGGGPTGAQLSRMLLGIG